MSEEEKGDRHMAFQVLTDEEFLASAAENGYPEELNETMLELRRGGQIQLFDDGTGDPLIVKIERTN